MARTAVTLESLTKTGATGPTGTAADPTNGHNVALAGVPLEEVVFRFLNTNGTNRVATIKAGANPPALSSGLGDTAMTVTATTGDFWIGGLESARYLQADGSVNIDLAASFAGTVFAIRVPR